MQKVFSRNTFKLEKVKRLFTAAVSSLVGNYLGVESKNSLNSHVGPVKPIFLKHDLKVVDIDI